VFDTLDVSTRLGRYLIQEVFGIRNALSAFFATLATVAVPLIFILFNTQGSYLQFWSLFGASNQLLAALTLLLITLWLYKARKRITFTLLPMLFVLGITSWALVDLAWLNFSQKTASVIAVLNGSIALLLLGLAMFLVITAIIKVRSESIAPVRADSNV
jgi:carbon starvation protein